MEILESRKRLDTWSRVQFLQLSLAPSIGEVFWLMSVFIKTKVLIKMHNIGLCQI